MKKINESRKISFRKVSLVELNKNQLNHILGGGDSPPTPIEFTKTTKPKK